MDWKLLAPLDPESRHAVLDSTRARSYAKDEVVFHEGDLADSVHLVEAGHLAVRVTTPSGDRATLNVLAPGDVVGELSLLTAGAPGQRSATVVALEPSRTRVLSAAVFDQLGRENPAVRDLLNVLLAERVRELSARLIETMYDGLDRRVLRRLAELAGSFGAGSSGGLDGSVVVPLTQDHLADMVGGTRPSVNQILQRLAAEGIVELGRGRITVRDPGGLRRLAAG